MDIRIQVAADGSLQFLTASHERVATLSPNAVTALSQLAQVPVEVNPIVHQHVQTIMHQLPIVRHELSRLGLTSQTDDGTVHLTAAGHQLATWLMAAWKPWARYIRTIPADAVAAWRWNVVYRAGSVDWL